MIRIGFELETTGTHPEHIIEALRKKGISASLNAYKGSMRELCTADTDGSVTYPSCEIQSPINPSRQEIQVVVDTLKEHNAKTDGSCGMHVHISDEESLQDIRVHIPRKIQVYNTREYYIWKEPLGSRGGVHQVNRKHVEVRLFNARIDTRYILDRIALVKASLKYVPALSKENNTWDAIFVKFNPKKALQHTQAKKKAKSLV